MGDYDFIWWMLTIRSLVIGGLLLAGGVLIGACVW